MVREKNDRPYLRYLRKKKSNNQTINKKETSKIRDFVERQNKEEIEKIKERSLL